MSIVEVRGLCKAFGDNQVLKNLDFQIEKGEVVTLIGPSGGGKTTLLRALNSDLSLFGLHSLAG